MKLLTSYWHLDPHCCPRGNTTLERSVASVLRGLMLLAYFSCMALSVRGIVQGKVPLGNLSLYTIYFSMAEIVGITSLKVPYQVNPCLISLHTDWKLSQVAPRMSESFHCCLNFNIISWHHGFIPLFSCLRNLTPRLKSYKNSCLLPY